MDYSRFFGRTADSVARDLLGRILVVKTPSATVFGKITETGAYEGGEETELRKGMKYGPATIFLMGYRGSDLFNIATDRKGVPSCVEVREIEIDDKKIKGSGRVSKALGVTQDLDGLVLGEKVQIAGESVDLLQIRRRRGQTDNCLGYYSIK